jgi:hypothetical protein
MVADAICDRLLHSAHPARAPAIMGYQECEPMQRFLFLRF